MVFEEKYMDIRIRIQVSLVIKLLGAKYCSSFLST